MKLSHLKRTYESFGRDDATYAVLSQERYRHCTREDIVAHGEKEIAKVLAYLRTLPHPLTQGKALDFGCGVGRLSQALAPHFASVVGVDIADSMIERARLWNAFGERVEYRVNSTDDLRWLADNSFDFVYSNITLQHIPPEASCRYIREFVRVLRGGGIGLFQVPSGVPFRSSLGAWLYRLRRIHLRRFWKILRGRYAVEIHYVPRQQVERLIMESGGRVLDVVDVSAHRREENFRYCFMKETRQ
jgi:SAM-dependent methyltransferase